jgi:hypothetical protein
VTAVELMERTPGTGFHPLGRGNRKLPVKQITALLDERSAV